MGGKESKNDASNDDQEVSEEVLEQSKSPDSDTKQKSSTGKIQSQTKVDRSNNLELYLNDLYKLELEFKISKEETEDIKNGIESLVRQIVHDTIRTPSFKWFNSVWKNTTMHANDECELFYDSQERFDDSGEKDTICKGSQCQRSYLHNECNILEDEDIYFDAVEDVQSNLKENKQEYSKPYNDKSDYFGFDYKTYNRHDCDAQILNNSKHCFSRSQLGQNGFENILKVGSIYENSKNHFPDEFDFIVVVDSSITLRVQSLLKSFHNCLQTVLERMKEEIYCIKIGKGSGIYFDMYVTAHGPASTLQFIYWREHSSKVKIHVDITPAVRLTNVNDHIKKENLVFKGWYEEIIRRNCCLAVYVQDPEKSLHKGSVRITVTEFETYLMRHVVSQKHLKIYRLLKYLINGTDETGDMKVICESITNTSCSDKHVKTTCSLSSYVIKTFLFRHHYTCSQTDDKLAGCLLDILNEIEQTVTDMTTGLLSTEKHTKRIRTSLNQELEILKNDTFENNMKLGKAFRYMKEQLQKLYRCNDVYKYKDCHITLWAESATNILKQQ